MGRQYLLGVDPGTRAIKATPSGRFEDGISPEDSQSTGSYLSAILLK
jgi:hypothetical protein